MLYILGFKYKVGNHFINYYQFKYSIKFPERHAKVYDFGSAYKSSISPDKSYLSFLIDEFGDVQKDPNVFHEAHDVAHCAVFNFKNGCLSHFGGVDDCGDWHDNNSIESAVEKNQFTDVRESEKGYKLDLLSYMKAHPDFKTIKNQDVKEWIQDNFGLENIKACTQ
jgi:hypothetical protein